MKPASPVIKGYDEVTYAKDQPEYKSDRRKFLRLGAGAAVGLAVGSSIACSPKSVGVEVSTVIAFLNKISPLLPAFAGKIAKVIKVAEDFNAQYQKGDFANAASIFANLSNDLDQLVSDIGANVPPIVKISIALADAACSAIAVLLHSQSNALGVSTVIAAKSKAGAQPMEVTVIQSRVARAERLFQAIR